MFREWLCLFREWLCLFRSGKSEIKTSLCVAILIPGDKKPSHSIKNSSALDLGLIYHLRSVLLRATVA